MDRSSVLAVVLQDPECVLVGWILWHPNLGEEAGKCVFLPLPVDPALFGNRAVEAVYGRQAAGESAWRVTQVDPLVVTVTTPGLAEEMFVELGAAGRGQWGFGTGTGRWVAGIARDAKPGAAADQSP